MMSMLKWYLWGCTLAVVSFLLGYTVCLEGGINWLTKLLTN